ncbi:hypothetical protein WKK05_23080 [Nostoc sp. UHCC 0302]|uniref:hypothetical protein n=1 Tax=Nostoc sp. UHCC 0302 TaxID=3134896 RepID=UPI00311CC5DD
MYTCQLQAETFENLDFGSRLDLCINIYNLLGAKALLPTFSIPQSGIAHPMDYLTTALASRTLLFF